MLNISPQVKNINFSTPSLAERFESILSGDQALGPKERFLLEYIQLIAYFRLAVMGRRETVFALSKALDLKEGVGEKRFGFSKEELRRFNVFVRDAYRTEGRLNELVDSIAARLARLGGEKD